MYSIVIIVFLAFPLLVIICNHVDGNIPLGSNLEKSDWLSFWGDLLSYIGTVFLGLMALYQNHIFNQENEKSQNRLERINNELVFTQKTQVNPIVDLDEEFEENLFFYQDGQVSMVMRNYGDKDIWECKIKSVSYVFNGSEYKSKQSQNRNYIRGMQQVNIHIPCDLISNQSEIKEDFSKRLKNLSKSINPPPSDTCLLKIYFELKTSGQVTFIQENSYFLRWSENNQANKVNKMIYERDIVFSVQQ